MRPFFLIVVGMAALIVQLPIGSKAGLLHAKTMEPVEAFYCLRSDDGDYSLFHVSDRVKPIASGYGASTCGGNVVNPSD